MTPTSRPAPRRRLNIEFLSRSTNGAPGRRWVVARDSDGRPAETQVPSRVNGWCSCSRGWGASYSSCHDCPDAIGSRCRRGGRGDRRRRSTAASPSSSGGSIRRGDYEGHLFVVELARTPRTPPTHRRSGARRLAAAFAGRVDGRIPAGVIPTTTSARAVLCSVPRPAADPRSPDRVGGASYRRPGLRLIAELAWSPDGRSARVRRPESTRRLDRR